MESCFFRIMRRLEKNKHISKWRIEEFLYIWGKDFTIHLQFILSHYIEINTLLQLALSSLKKTKLIENRTAFLLRHDQLSLCLNYFDQIVTPLYIQKEDRAVKMIRSSNQKVLSRWDTTTYLPDTAVANNVGAINSPGRMDTFFKDE